MATIQFVTWDGGGNLPPALGIARELERQRTHGADHRRGVAAFCRWFCGSFVLILVPSAL